mgnify:CR=1 FL=1
MNISIWSLNYWKRNKKYFSMILFFIMERYIFLIYIAEKYKIYKGSDNKIF